MKSELLYTMADYQAEGRDVPPQLSANPELSDGDLMTADDVAAFVKDSIATLRILSDKRSPHWDRVHEMFEADMAALLKLGHIEEDEYNGLIDESNLRF